MSLSYGIRLLSVCVSCVFTFSKVFSSGTTGPIEVKFHLEPPLDGGNESLHMGSRSHDQDGRHAHIW